MKHLEFSLVSTLRMGEPVIGHYYSLRILPGDDPAQTVALTHREVNPCEHAVIQRDGWGNILLVGEAQAEHDEFSYRVEGTAEVDSARGHGTYVNQAYRFASPLVGPGPTIRALHEQAGAFDDGSGRITPGKGASARQPDSDAHAQAVAERAEALRTLVYHRMDYISGTTNVETTAEHALAAGRGVCQDYAHIYTALLRMDGIPARYVCGLMGGEGATHAWVEFFDGRTWWGQDPTNDCVAGDTYIVLARGRDFSDCPMERGIFFGGAMQFQMTHVKVAERL